MEKSDLQMGMYNGETRRGRSMERQDDGPGLERLSLTECHEGDIIAIATGNDEKQEAHMFIKQTNKEGAAKGWLEIRQTEEGEQEVPVELCMLEPNRFGNSFITYSVVLRRGYELGIVEVGGTTLYNLGPINELTKVDLDDAMLDQQAAETPIILARAS